MLHRYYDMGQGMDVGLSTVGNPVAPKAESRMTVEGGIRGVLR
ncbi:hypothetical protein [Dickeya zeae]|nr:hypothetical protein [Dickeya zeae]